MMQCARRDHSRRARLEAVQRRLRDHPCSSRAWFWQIQIKILTYVLSVYGDLEPSEEPRVYRYGSRGSRGRFGGTKSSAEIRRLVRDIAFLHRYPTLMDQGDLRRRFVEKDLAD